VVKTQEKHGAHNKSRNERRSSFLLFSVLLFLLFCLGVVPRLLASPKIKKKKIVIRYTLLSFLLFPPLSRPPSDCFWWTVLLTFSVGVWVLTKWKRTKEDLFCSFFPLPFFFLGFGFFSVCAVNFQLAKHNKVRKPSRHVRWHEPRQIEKKRGLLEKRGATQREQTEMTTPENSSSKFSWCSSTAVFGFFAWRWLRPFREPLKSKCFR